MARASDCFGGGRLDDALDILKELSARIDRGGARAYLGACRDREHVDRLERAVDLLRLRYEARRADALRHLELLRTQRHLAGAGTAGAAGWLSEEA